MKVENLFFVVQQELLKRLLVHKLPALAYVDLLVLHPVEGLVDINDRYALEKLLLAEQHRVDVTEDERKKTIALLVYYWRVRGKGESDFLPDFVKDLMWDIDESEYVDDDRYDERLAAMIDLESDAQQIPIINTKPRTTFEDLFDEES